MNQIQFNPSIAPETKKDVLDKLATLQKEENVHILFAIESGSRAWGFPSPDSDYDARFVYARPVDWYLSIASGRDVIELPIEGDLDINGWDIKKALGLLLKPNPVLLEWLSSPIRYIWNNDVCNALIEFSKKTTHGQACLNHYLHLGQRQWDVYVKDRTEVNLKKYFYIVRPAMALRWIRLHPEVAPPMNFQELLKGCELEPALTEKLGDLLIAKSHSKELGEASRIPEIDAFINSEFDWAHDMTSKMDAQKPDLSEEADALFRTIIRSVGRV